jgi:hypothetical protein
MIFVLDYNEMVGLAGANGIVAASIGVSEEDSLSPIKFQAVTLK